jgi:CheY-like chemotaxis protein/predicted regulator of Ras-like GTPase activity (Roadblock/LC7/MglB family)
MEKVLIVEDNPVLIKILRTGLKKYSDKFETVTARDGEEAIEVLKKESISLLVTDLQMPRIDGLSLLAYMNDHHPEVPCIVMTAHGTQQIKDKLQQDVLRFIEKPFEIDDLVQAILPALDRGIPVGSINGISIASFMQMIEMEQKTCLFEVESPNDGKGYFYFEDGILYDAVYGDNKGLDAALKLIPLEDAKIRFKNVSKSKRKIAKRIKNDLMSVIMEAMRLKDEADAGDDEDFDISSISEELPEIEGFNLLETEKPTLEPEEPVLKPEEIFQEELISEEIEPPKKPEREPLLKTAQDDFGINLKGYLEELKNISGYRAAAVMNYTGEVLEKDSTDSEIDLTYLSAMFNDIFLSANKVCEKVGFEANRETTIITPKGIVLMQCSGAKSKIHIHVIVIMEPGGNQALMKMEMERMMPGLLKELD